MHSKRRKTLDTAAGLIVDTTKRFTVFMSIVIDYI